VISVTACPKTNGFGQADNVIRTPGVTDSRKKHAAFASASLSPTEILQQRGETPSDSQSVR
jgi:hypothetical protein